MSALILLAGWFSATALLVGIFNRRLWHSLSASLRLYLGLGWALVSIGVIQAMFTPLRFTSFDESALWFATSGSAVVLTGALNLLNVRGQRQDAGLRRVCMAANAWVTLVFVAVATHRGQEPLHDPVSAVLVAVAGAATVLSGDFLRAAPGRPSTDDVAGSKDA